MYEQQRRQIGEKLLETAAGLFRQKGYDSVTVQEITSAVGVAKGTFYNFFDSKRSLLMAWAAGRFARMAGELPEAGQPAEEGMRRLADAVAAAAGQDWVLFASFLRELSQAPGGAPEDAFDLSPAIAVVLRRSSDFACIGEAGLDLKVRALNSLLFAGLLDRTLSGGGPEGLAESLKATLHVCINGIYE